ncbi:MAG: cation diffusion facilitator family transporter [Clostridiales bacterium]|nr:cation diffusion facilitator family transporter [Clostridiales bacterium]MDY4621942.1 cation diffusion facilitator family transporter [Eubacteriales bacterium]
MIKLLSRIFIKDYNNYESPAVRSSYGVLCGGFGIFLNILLFIGKFLAGTLAKSVSITADAFNNLADAGSSIITLLGFRLARQKPDTKHPFGHGRIEYIAGLLVSAAIILMGFELAKSSISKIISPEPIEFSVLTAAILVCSILVKLYMVFYNKSIGKKIKSATLGATALDSCSDCIATSVVLVSSLIAHFFKINIDGYCGVLVAAFVIYSGIRALQETITPLLGQAPDREFIERIQKLIEEFPEITGIHDLIVHDYGPGRLMISLHAEMPVYEDSDIFAMHDIIDNAERLLSNELECLVTIHLDPTRSNDEKVAELKAKTVNVLHGISPELSLHDFRVVPGPTHTNLIFDVVIPFDLKLKEDEITEKLNSAVSEWDDAKYYVVVSFDRPYA